ncbi:hypothetical protein FGO68_gene4698 [Halteria grandinella]|uniref:Uncharacterized protein n=1 Tax=Halteria grandinella TaxID=5974 RepID=A0A8J8NJ66_HALGN|nr:hypothetical protein FGO68_gene4698 [Halteria grandinella]
MPIVLCITHPPLQMPLIIGYQSLLLHSQIICNTGFQRGHPKSTQSELRIAVCTICMRKGYQRQQGTEGCYRLRRKARGRKRGRERRK